MVLIVVDWAKINRQTRSVRCGRSQFGRSHRMASSALIWGKTMGTWACGFIVGLCVGQLTLALVLGVFRRDRAEAMADPLDLPASEHEALIILTPNAVEVSR